jgi:hypothetical protein
MNWSTPTKKTLNEKLYPWLMPGLMIAIGAVVFTVAMLVHDARAAEQPNTCNTDEECAAVCMKTAKTKQQKINCWAIVSTSPEEDCKAEGDCSEEPRPAQYRFRPWQEIWQCNDLRVTVTGNAPGTVNYDIAGSIWGGINFTFDGPRHQLYKGAWPCVPLR